MSDVGILIVLYGVGVVILVAEIFIPSHGILTVAGLGFLASAVFQTFSTVGREAGIIAVIVCLLFIPTLAYLAIKYWPLTPIGRRIAPPNPVLTEDDSPIPIAELSALVGHCGQSLSPLRPVGICEFDGRRFSCVAEFGMVESGVAVVATGVKYGQLAVVEKNA